MTYAPASLQNLRSYLVGMGQPVVGIVGDENHTGGYHLGRDRLRLTDYSRQLYRDKLGLTNAASAIDLGMSPRLRELSNYLVAESKAGRARDIREVIYSPDGAHVLRWDAANERTTPNSDLSHLSHTHISYYRDSEYVDKRPLYVRFYSPEDIVKVYSVPGIISAVAPAGTPYYDSPEDPTPNGKTGGDGRYLLVGQDKATDPTRYLVDGVGNGTSALMSWLPADALTSRLSESFNSGVTAAAAEAAKAKRT